MIDTSLAQNPISGIVRSVNPKGLKLEGEDDWRNFSKFAEDLAVPERGQYVTLTLDRSGFIRSVDTAEIAQGATMSAPSAQQAASNQQRERTITRLAVLKAASEFAATRSQLKSGDVLAIAATWERWVNREQDNTYDLTDAF